MKKIIEPRQTKPIEEFTLPSYQEIPDIGLFLDQTTKYINSFISPLRDTALTGSMISNYVKKKIIPNPIKKLYYRDQIALLFFIAIAKTVIPLDDVVLMFSLMEDQYDIKTAYEYFRAEFTEILLNVYALKEIPDTAEENNSELKSLLRNIIITAANKAYLAECFANMREKN